MIRGSMPIDGLPACFPLLVFSENYCSMANVIPICTMKANCPEGDLQIFLPGFVRSCSQGFKILPNYQV